MALIDHNYKFRWVEVGANGAASDSMIWNDCDLSDAVLDGTAGIPDGTPLRGTTQAIPNFIIIDDAFALQVYMMKPFAGKTLSYPEKIFNYRLSQARRVVENAFGI